MIDDSTNIYMKKHLRNCAYDEANVCIKLKKDKQEIIRKQMDGYKKEGFPLRYGLSENNIIIRFHNSIDCVKLMDLWFEEFKTKSKRDQLSFNYCVWKTKTKIKYYDGNEHLKSRKHSKSNIVVQLHKNENKPLCVFGVLNTKDGLLIRDEMFEWLSKEYEVYEILHNGAEFEYPALNFMMKLISTKKESCLYIHTKGAVNKNEMQANIRLMWKDEFVNNKQWYINKLKENINEKVVLCPFTGIKKTTWLNAFL